EIMLVETPGSGENEIYLRVTDITTGRYVQAPLSADDLEIVAHILPRGAAPPPCGAALSNLGRSAALGQAARSPCTPDPDRGRVCHPQKRDAAWGGRRIGHPRSFTPSPT